jgi:DNA-binding IclR family transcriptional regulator
MRAVRAALQARPSPLSAEEIARTFKGAKAPKVAELLATLADVGQARPTPDGRYAA